MASSPSSSADDVTLTFGGNATTLLRLGPFTLLTDPNFLRRGQREGEEGRVHVAGGSHRPCLPAWATRSAPGPRTRRLVRHRRH